MRDTSAVQTPTDPYDEAAVTRALAGDRTVTLRRPDRFEIVRRARLSGLSLRDIERVTGMTKPERYIVQSQDGAA